MTSPSLIADATSETEESLRIETAALYRAVEYLGWGEGIYNHIATRLPGSGDEFLIKQHALTYEEVKASNLVKVDAYGELDPGLGVNKVGFSTHAPIMRARPDVNCSIHLHTVPIMAIAAHPAGLRMLHQHSVRFYQDVAYQDYDGFAETPEAQQALIEAIGDKRVLVLRNHGALITGKSIEDAFVSLIRFVYACEVQLTLEAAGQGMVEMADDVCKRAVEQFRHHDSGRGGADWPAYLRRMHRLDPSFGD